MFTRVPGVVTRSHMAMGFCMFLFLFATLQKVCGGGGVLSWLFQHLPQSIGSPIHHLLAVHFVDGGRFPSKIKNRTKK